MTASAQGFAQGAQVLPGHVFPREGGGNNRRNKRLQEQPSAVNSAVGPPAESNKPTYCGTKVGNVEDRRNSVEPLRLRCKMGGTLPLAFSSLRAEGEAPGGYLPSAG